MKNKQTLEQITLLGDKLKDLNQYLKSLDNLLTLCQIVAEESSSNLVTNIRIRLPIPPENIKFIELSLNSPVFTFGVKFVKTISQNQHNEWTNKIIKLTKELI